MCSWKYVVCALTLPALNRAKVHAGVSTAGRAKASTPGIRLGSDPVTLCEVFQWLKDRARASESMVSGSGATTIAALHTRQRPDGLVQHQRS